jgi:hypothetical protein
MDAQKAVTLVAGREVPEEEVQRSAGGTPAPLDAASQSFQARSAETVILKSRRRKAGDPALGENLPVQFFEAREAGTVTLRPPHWEGLAEAAPAPEVEARPPAGETPAPQAPEPLGENHIKSEV